jgi:L-alanine-DL-glutamate epimerase-like enolase superfamily enzyme
LDLHTPYRTLSRGDVDRVGAVFVRIQTSITVRRGTTRETVALARDYAQRGFRILKIKSSHDPEEDVRRMRAVRDALPRLTLRLDAKGGYTVQQALDAADGLNVKLVACGGLRCARQMDAIARAAELSTMVGCVHEPALLIAAGLGFALSSGNVRYGDLDGFTYLPTVPGFVLEEGWLIARDVPGLGCRVEI